MAKNSQKQTIIDKNGLRWTDMDGNSQNGQMAKNDQIELLKTNEITG